MEYDWKEAENCYKRAVEINPSQSDCHTGYSLYLRSVGRVDEAILEAKRAVELDPLSSLHLATLGQALVWAGQFDQAIEISQEALELEANHNWALSVLAWAHAGKGMYDKAISIMQGLRKMPIAEAYLGYAYGKADKMEEAHKTLNDLLDRSKKGYYSPYMIATVYSGLGEKDKAFEWLDRAYEVHDPIQVWIKVDIVFNSLHSDPRWAEQMKKRGLAD